jgi:predicted dehydrogenase/threonine dehydrogenase-like Zn-dependent dehydrogenase
MKQLLQNLKTGATVIAEVPCPAVARGHVLIRTTHSLVSAGTERMIVDFGKAGWLAKARKQPEKVRQVLDKIRSDGILPTIEAVSSKLDDPMPLGYCNAGEVLETGAGVIDLHPGDRVASNGPHAEVVCVPRNLCAKIPDGVSNEAAAFTALGSIALQGVRLASPSFGERFVVFGLGLVGLFTTQILRASGCPVLAVDVSEQRLWLAEAFGAETADLGKGTDPVSAAMNWTSGRGVDGVIIAAAAKDDQIVHQAAQACRKRGRIVLVGVVDLNLRRGDFYEKEITFQVSCSYGPGRYDEKYEQEGRDYPLGFVRWTEQRNFEAVLEAMRAGQLRVNELVTHRFPLEAAARIYENVLQEPEALGIVIEYPSRKFEDQASFDTRNNNHARLGQNERKPGRNGRETGGRAGEGGQSLNLLAGQCGVALIGAGNFCKMVLAPALAKTRARLLYVVTRKNAAMASHIARKYRFDQASTNLDAVLADTQVNTVFIATPHNTHPHLICKSLAAQKHVLVEKPVAIDMNGLNQVIDALRNHSGQYLSVGFNRRFSPHITKIKELLAGRIVPLCMSMTINAGFIPPEHWVQDPERGGGRIIGEACHFIDLMAFLSGSLVTTVCSMMVGGNGPNREDKMSILLGFADGSVGSVQYFANGAKSYPKETLEVFAEGRVIRMENYRVTTGFGFKGFRSFRTWRQDKGHQAEIAAFVEHVSAGGAPLIPIEEIVNVTKASFAALESARTEKVISV